jgi:4-amino-4-deoxy-L-arabinose transferase-like glycosyltransferase
MVQSTPLMALARPVFLLGLSGVSFIVTLSLSVRGALSTATASLLLPLAFVASVVGVWRAALALGVVAGARPLLRRHGFWLLVLLSALTFPLLGGFGLIDPWETHYAEVAREMLERADFISPWWAHEGWFMSKPILLFWLEALSMSAFGVETGSGQVLGVAAHMTAHPEWAARLPGALFLLVGCYLLYRGIAASAGRRAGLLASVVLATSAQWTLAARHALTDTPFVGALTAAFGLLLWAWSTPEEARLRRYELQVGRRRIAWDASLALIGLVVCVVLPQLLALVLSNALEAGSPGNCGLPSQPACGPMPMVHPKLKPALQALGWGALLFGFGLSVRREKRCRRWLLLGAWYCLGLATMAKGIAGVALPLAVAGTYLLLHGRWRELGQSELMRGAALIALLAGPWYLAMFARHGRVIFDELVLRHMLGRALDHLHDTNAGEDVGFCYYARQLGYAMFPWIGLVPGALLAAGAAPLQRSEGAQRSINVALLWLVITFSLFTLMRTKFHHYILPAVPALAVLVGVCLAEQWDQGGEVGPHRAAVARVAGFGGALLVVLVGVDLVVPVRDGIPGAARLFHLLSYQYRRAWPSELDFTEPLSLVAGACSVLCLALTSARWRRALISAQIAVSVIFAGWLAHRYLVSLGPAFGQRHVIEAFYRSRSSPAEPLIAYQLNWKGENFYTGNRLAIFVSSGKALRRYLTERASAGESGLHFVLESARLKTLRAERGAVARFDVLTDPHASDKYSLVRVELE